ncbi:MAG: rod shape-determining protein [Desertifilum sp.]|nr:rod shape-determining protein [Desertifilum sp.]
MFKFLAFRTLYVQLKPDWLLVKLVSSHGSPTEYADIPCIAFRGKIEPGSLGEIESNKVLAIGQQAIQLHQQQTSTTSLLNGFEHPRTIISNFFVAELTLKHFIQKTYQGQTSLIAPQIIIHPLSHLEGGLTQIEARALTELGSQMGARQVFLYLENDTPLRDEEILKIDNHKQAIKTL